MLFALLFAVTDAQAQFSGSIGIGGQTTNNVQSLDTTAPDQILLPTINLNYDWLPSAVSKITFSGSYDPNFYSVNPALSFNATTLGATGLFYLTNQDAIAKESMREKTSSSPSQRHSTHFERIPEAGDVGLSPFKPRGLFFSPEPPPNVQTRMAEAAMDERNDSLVDLASSALYTLSGQLDSTDISSTGLSKARAQELDDLKDSVSDALSTVADLLDSVGYSESVAEIVTKELENLHTPLARLMAHTKPSHTDPHLLDVAIASLRAAKPEDDFLSTAPPPMPSSSASIETKTLLETLQKLPPAPGRISYAEQIEAPAPAITLVTSATRLREFGYSDVSIHEDADDSGATTLATTLTTPISWSSHTGTNFSPADSLLFGGVFAGNPNDNHLLTFGAAVEGLPSRSFSLRGGYSYSRATYAFDSVNSNTENRFTLTPRLAVGRTTVLFGEAAIGFRNYFNPLVLTVTPAKYDTLHRPKKGDTIVLVKSAVTQTAGSKFNQYSYGIGLAQFIGERWVIGALLAFNNNPNLRAYVTNAQVLTGPRGRAVRAAVQVAEDEYTYDLARYGIFTNARLPWDMDIGFDLSREHRVYGSAVGPKGAILQQGRTEDGVFINASLSKLIPFEYRLASIFNSLMIAGRLAIEHVNSTVALYSFNATVLTLTTSLGF